ncbi:MAG: hypothetical protein ACJ0KA_09670 [Verrucomicrobiales bacterium]
MNKILTLTITIISLVLFSSSCDKHEWEDTKKLFEPHGSSEGEH